MAFRFSGESHVGCVYTHNEDAIGWSITNSIWFVADGMGGYSNGELASSIVKQTILKGVANPDVPLKQRVLDAHQAIVDEIARERGPVQMGSTLVLLQIKERNCQVAWVGDSRAYLWRKCNLVQINRDHTFIQSLIDEGMLDPQNAFNHPRKNELLQALGMGVPKPELTELHLESHDWLILCSDGLHDVVTQEEIIDVLKDCELPNEATQKLIQASLDRGVDDNVSVIVVECPEFSPEGILEHISSILGARKRSTDADFD
jgi:serine/threonine protein phosphatase PrpC